MSIMIDTYIFKKDGKHTVYRAGGFTFPSDYIDAAKAEKVSVFELFQQMRAAKYNDWWGKCCAEGLSDEEVVEIGDATNCIGGNGYSKHAGDVVYLIDLDNKSVYCRKRDPEHKVDGIWKEMV